MFVSMFHVPVPEERRQAFEQGFAHRARAVDRMPGFRGMEVLKSTERPEYVVVTRWDTRADYERWLHGPEFVMGHGGQPYDPGQVEGMVGSYEVISL